MFFPSKAHKKVLSLSYAYYVSKPHSVVRRIPFRIQHPRAVNLEDVDGCPQLSSRNGQDCTVSSARQAQEAAIYSS